MKRNHVIINGIRSDAINGLLIQELPPVVKPLMRSEIEEIDGRDGSVVTLLGYEAYDKEMVIGLHGNYNIDDVIQYFNSEGVVTFSNEPDKIYSYKILNSINFERLARFRTATVTFYVQPFKFSAIDETVDVAPTGTSMSVINNGNIYSRPQITIYGSGNITLYINGSVVCTIALGSYGNITIDSNAMEAYQGNTLLNRIVTGDYNRLTFQKGKNTLAWNGSVSRIVIKNRSRWI